MRYFRVADVSTLKNLNLPPPRVRFLEDTAEHKFHVASTSHRIEGGSIPDRMKEGDQLPKSHQRQLKTHFPTATATATQSCNHSIHIVVHSGLVLHPRTLNTPLHHIQQPRNTPSNTQQAFPSHFFFSSPFLRSSATQPVSASEPSSRHAAGSKRTKEDGARPKMTNLPPASPA